MVLKVVKIKFEDDEREVYGVLDTSDGFFLTYDDIGIDRDGILVSPELDELLRDIEASKGVKLKKWGRK